MEPRIQYAKTSDGVNIAFWTMGKGALPLVGLPYHLSDLRVASRIPEMRRALERMAQNRMLVHYDGRVRRPSPTPSLTRSGYPASFSGALMPGALTTGSNRNRRRFAR